MAGLFVDARVAIVNVFEHRRRALFLGTAIAVVTMLLVLLSALASSVRGTLVDSATVLNSGHLNVGGFAKIAGGQATPALTHASAVLRVVRETMPNELDAVVMRGRGWAKVISDHGSLLVALAGVEIADEQGLKRLISLRAGRLEDLAEPGSMLIFEEQAKRLGVGVGDALTVSAQTPRGAYNTVDVRVVAVAHDIGMVSKWGVYIPAASLRALYQHDVDTTGAIQIYMRPGRAQDLGPLAQRLRERLAAAGHRVLERDPRPYFLKFNSVSRGDWTGQKLDVSSWEDELSFMTWPVQMLDGLTFVLAVVMLSVVIAGIVSTMWVAVRERTREIGALRAIGMQRLNVVRMFMLESLVLGVLAASAGALLGVICAALINAARLPVPDVARFFVMTEELQLTVRPQTVLAAIGVLTITTGFAALLPALRGARLRPIDAVSHFK